MVSLKFMGISQCEPAGSSTAIASPAPVAFCSHSNMTWTTSTESRRESWVFDPPNPNLKSELTMWGTKTERTG
jgi:hypothetical protein